MFKALKKYKELPQWIQDIVMPIVEGGSHWFHPENVKLAMLADSRIEVRRKAIDLILEDRKNPYQQKKPKSGKGSEKKFGFSTYLNFHMMQILMTKSLTGKLQRG